MNFLIESQFEKKLVDDFLEADEKVVLMHKDIKRREKEFRDKYEHNRRFKREKYIKGLNDFCKEYQEANKIEDEAFRKADSYFMNKYKNVPTSLGCINIYRVKNNKITCISGVLLSGIFHEILSFERAQIPGESLKIYTGKEEIAEIINSNKQYIKFVQFCGEKIKS